jgi:predicted DNA-binding transcriptional regulator AlpA
MSESINQSKKNTYIDFDELPNSANVRLPVLKVLYGVSAATLWRCVKSGRIPQPRKLTPRTTAWNVGDLRQALKDNF